MPGAEDLLSGSADSPILNFCVLFLPSVSYHVEPSLLQRPGRARLCQVRLGEEVQRILRRLANAHCAGATAAEHAVCLAGGQEGYPGTSGVFFVMPKIDIVLLPLQIQAFVSAVFKTSIIITACHFSLALQPSLFLELLWFWPQASCC